MIRVGIWYFNWIDIAICSHVNVFTDGLWAGPLRLWLRQLLLLMVLLLVLRLWCGPFNVMCKHIWLHRCSGCSKNYFFAFTFRRHSYATEYNAHQYTEFDDGNRKCGTQKHQIMLMIPFVELIEARSTVSATIIFMLQQRLAQCQILRLWIEIWTILVAICEHAARLWHRPIDVTQILQPPQRHVIIQIAIYGTAFEVCLRQIDCGRQLKWNTVNRHDHIFRCFSLRRELAVLELHAVYLFFARHTVARLQHFHHQRLVQIQSNALGPHGHHRTKCKLNEQQRQHHQKILSTKQWNKMEIVIA